MNVFIWIVFYLLCLGWLRITIFKIYTHTHTHNVNISKVEYNFNGSTSLCSGISLYCTRPLFLFCASHSVWNWACLTQTAQSSSSESILQGTKTKPPVGLVFLVRDELEVVVLQKTICSIISFSSTFGEGKGWHQAAFRYGDCLQIPCSWARTLSFILRNSKSFLWQSLWRRNRMSKSV